MRLAKLWPILLAAAGLYLVGLDWGLPSSARAERVLAPSQRQDDFYRALEDNRRAMYARIGFNVAATYGRGDWNGELLPTTNEFRLIRYPAGIASDATLMHGYSSFLLRSVEQDEQFTLNALSHMKPRRLDFNTHQTSNGGAFVYPLAAFMAALHVVGFTHLTSDPLYYYREPGALGRLFEAGRLFSVLCALGCVAMVFLIGRLAFGEKAGLWSAALFGLSPVLTTYAHIMKPHVPATFLSLWCLYHALKAALEKKPGELLPASVLFGLAVSAAKYQWILALPLWLCWHQAHVGKITARRFWQMAGLNALAVAVYALTNVYALIDWRDLLAEMRGEGGWYHSGLDPTAIARLLGMPMRNGLGPALWGLAVCGLAGALWTRRQGEKLLLTAFVPLIVAIAFLVNSAAGEAATIRFSLTAVALLVVLTAGWLLKQIPKQAPALLGLALAGTACVSALFDANFALDASGRSNAADAARWIETRTPPLKELGFGTPAPMLDRFPPVRFLDHDLVSLNDAAPSRADEKKLPLWYVTSGRKAEDLPPSVRNRYEVVRTFDFMSGWCFMDPFTSANYPLLLLSRKAL